MGVITGERSVEIAATVQRCYEIAADWEHAPEWQESLKDVEVLERDAEGRPAKVQTESDAKVKRVRTTLRASYEPPHAVRWVQEKGEVKSLEGSWTFDELGEGRTRATYSLATDPGRMLGLLLRGPAQDMARNFLLGSAAEGLKQRAESG
jgi:ribosome-associated toxin RatA of RatAB toxin-antitoxin module